jgi:hypothetical protein
MIAEDRIGQACRRRSNADRYVECLAKAQQLKISNVT